VFSVRIVAASSVTAAPLVNATILRPPSTSCAATSPSFALDRGETDELAGSRIPAVHVRLRLAARGAIEECPGHEHVSAVGREEDRIGGRCLRVREHRVERQRPHDLSLVHVDESKRAARERGSKAAVRPIEERAAHATRDHTEVFAAGHVEEPDLARVVADSQRSTLRRQRHR
jgi:hypothetical protein